MLLNFKILLMSLFMLFSGMTLPKTLDNYNKHKSYLSESHDVLEHYPKRSIEAWMMADAYIYCLKEYQITVPLNIALAQAHRESGFGKTNKNNPYNIRNGNSYDLFDSPEEGVLEYFKLMCTSYLTCKTEKQLLSNFTNCGGYRYAESPTYESALKKTINEHQKLRDND